MKPSEFLELTRKAGATGSASASDRVYHAMVKGSAAESFLTLHTRNGQFQALPYSGLQFISGDDRGGTSIRLIFTKMAIVIEGRQLTPVFEGLRSRTAAHLYEFSGGRHDPPQPGEPIIAEISFKMEQASARPGV